MDTDRSNRSDEANHDASSSDSVAAEAAATCEVDAVAADSTTAQCNSHIIPSSASASPVFVSSSTTTEAATATMAAVKVPATAAAVVVKIPAAISAEQAPSPAEPAEAAAAGAAVALAPAVVVDKVKIHLVAVGSAPILKKTKFLIASHQRFSAVTAFVTQRLNPPQHHNVHHHHHHSSSSALSQSQSPPPVVVPVFLYCQSCFCPGPEERIGDLRDCFAGGGDNELIVHYSIQEAWG